MRLTTWNVNGIRNPFSYPPWNNTRSFKSMFDILESDIVVMQELKIQKKDLRDDMVLVDGWDCYFSLPKYKKGYSGVGIYTRNATCAPIRAEEGLLGVLQSPSGTPYRDLPESESIGGYPSAFQVAELGVDPAALDAEGRCVIVEFPAFVLFGVYVPANTSGLQDAFRSGFFLALDCRIRNLMRQGKRVVLVGDLNVTRHEIDSAGHLEDIRKRNATHEDIVSGPNRRIFNQLLTDGEVIGERDEGRDAGVLWDTTRGFHPTRRGMYTHWDTKKNARPGNSGSRIDFVLVADVMQSWVKDANIQEGLLGSDHCPVYADFHDVVDDHGRNVSLLEIMNPPGVFENGQRKVEWTLQSTPAFSAKRMPEFDKRRSIKSMFAAPPVKKFASSQLERTPSGIDPAAQANAPSADISPHEDKAAASQSDEARPPTKRKASIPSKDPLPSKKQKDTKAAPSKGQKSLKGFFSSKASPVKPDLQSQESSQKTSITSPPAEVALPPPQSPSTTFPSQEPPSPTASASPTADQVATQIASAERSQRSWGALFTKPPAPLCEGHEEPCKTLQTKKKGSNQGRSFWMCARPLGPSGEKEKGTEWRCGTFIWASDLKGGGGG
ncbi:APN2 DNA lyase apurinic/apyrimidinic [Zymoseptoria tritici IPO323]|uniref:DNA-(apurinic or apyrimidinic site) endonuclease 2 n=2 Tax=Zymoseptoria tritici TaxID=1047171 RepID=F9XQ38_ZYMTI|nr:APN2 DNA lyase apurinic/apyrimidinic [Zymoseptoria tritici IPO323]EGP82573.1 APN2 DNA lyase apurinic/apyrimidinic [Zymoseptoria tritici IPO323]